ncbi:MAG: 3-oxoacyl-[acyl-carrier-protein] synthase 2 [Candidatus Binatia bacterium]|nr:MAG: 3-oxoacyl-[acyl-carrier-protein] synthase 2 [Candidatus Binatia bacterium]
MSLGRRVVVTGMGLVTPLGVGVEPNWQALLEGRSGVGPITRFDASDFPVRIAAEVKDFRVEDFLEKREARRMDRFSHFAVAAARMAVENSGLQLEPDARERAGIVLGVGMGGIETIEENLFAYFRDGLKRVSPFFVPRLIANMASGQLAIHLGWKGPNYVTTSACASGNHAIGEAFHRIRDGYAEVMLAGGSEAAVTPLGVGGFAVMKALSTRNDEPERASRPFDRGRDGFVVGEGAAILVLEELGFALRRKARILGEILGYGATADAHHITAPAPEGEGAARCLVETLRDAGLEPRDVDYINAHGTSTPYNDIVETQAIKKVFGEHAYRLAVSSTKSQTGHLLGAAGAVEAAYTLLALSRGVLPATWNYEDPDPECDLDYVPNRPRPADIRVAISNSFGFGGTNACLAFRRWGPS